MREPPDGSGLPGGGRRTPVPIWAAVLLLVALYACVMTGSLREGEISAQRNAEREASR